MNRLIFTLLMSVTGFAAIVSFSTPDTRSFETSLDESGVEQGCRVTDKPPGQTPAITRPRRLYGHCFVSPDGWTI